MSSRKSKWNPPPVFPQTPRVLLQLSRRPRRSKSAKSHGRQSVSLRDVDSCGDGRGKLEGHFDEDGHLSRNVPIVLLSSENHEARRRCHLSERELNTNEKVYDEPKDEEWRFQEDVLRAECNFLRLDREIAIRKLEQNRVLMETTLKSAVETLVSGKRKINEGKNRSVLLLLEAEINDLEKKLEKLQREEATGKAVGIRNCSSNFDKQATCLQRQLEKFEESTGEKCVKEIREMVEASLMVDTSCRQNQKKEFTDVETLRKKMENFSKGILERMEEMLSSSTSASSGNNGSPVSTSKKPVFHRLIRGERQENFEPCSGHCKAIIKKIVEHVCDESEQWSQMQEMLKRVREEMDELQASRNFWEERSLESDDKIQCLKRTLRDWQQKYSSAQTLVSDLRKQISDLHFEVDKMKGKLIDEVSSKNHQRLPQTQKDTSIHFRQTKDIILNIEKNKASKFVGSSQRRRPLQDIGNSFLVPRLRQDKAAFVCIDMNDRLPKGYYDETQSMEKIERQASP